MRNWNGIANVLRKRRNWSGTAQNRGPMQIIGELPTKHKPVMKVLPDGSILVTAPDMEPQIVVNGVMRVLKAHEMDAIG